MCIIHIIPQMYNYIDTGTHISHCLFVCLSVQNKKKRADSYGIEKLYLLNNQ